MFPTKIHYACNHTLSGDHFSVQQITSAYPVSKLHDDIRTSR